MRPLLRASPGRSHPRGRRDIPLHPPLQPAPQQTRPSQLHTHARRGDGLTDLVPAKDIERIVGVARHPIEHWGRAVSTEQTVYILHSKECLDKGGELRDCPYSEALD